MTKLLRLQVYLDKLNNSLSSNVPEKHKGHPKEYKQFLNNEIQAVKGQIESLVLENPTGAKK